jgi:hypothetical protein
MASSLNASQWPATFVSVSLIWLTSRYWQSAKRVTGVFMAATLQHSHPFCVNPTDKRSGYLE